MLKSKECKESIENILSSTSLQFLLSPIRTKRKFIKILNTCFLIASLIVSVLMITQNITEYLNYKTVTSIQIINEIEPEFPTVSFCPYNQTALLNIDYLWLNNEKMSDDWHYQLEVYNDTSFGKCYRFNSGLNMYNKTIPIKRSKRGGISDGLHTYLNTSKDSVRLYIFIHNNTFKPSTIINRGYWISSNTDFSIAIKKIFDQKLEQPFNDCYKNISDFHLNKTLINFFLNKNLEYSQKECERMGRNLKFIETSQCNCSIDFDQDLFIECYSKQKENSETQKCFESKMKNLNQINIISEYCPLKCDSYAYEISMQNYQIENTPNYNKFQFHIYYEDLKYTYICQEAKIEFIGLISNIGGSLSLFVGISFISFLELFELLVEVFYFNFRL
jgi:hypothetical protein